MTFFLSLLYQESELYRDDYFTPENILILLVWAALAAIPFVVVFWWILRRNRPRTTTEGGADKAGKPK
jgi:hypothetical protein